MPACVSWLIRSVFPAGIRGLSQCRRGGRKSISLLDDG